MLQIWTDLGVGRVSIQLISLASRNVPDNMLAMLPQGCFHSIDIPSE